MIEGISHKGSEGLGTVTTGCTALPVPYQPYGVEIEAGMGTNAISAGTKGSRQQKSHVPLSQGTHQGADPMTSPLSSVLQGPPDPNAAAAH